MFKNFDPAKHVITWAGILFQGPASGTFLSAERADDAFKLDVGAAGDVTRVRNRNRTGSVTYTCQAASPLNDQLSARAALDEAFGTGVGPLQVKDLNGNTVLHAEYAWIRKMPTVEIADEASNREWIFDCADLAMTVGGSVL